MKRTEHEIITEISNVWGDLSPENLSCDGELPMAEQRRRASRLNKQLRELFRELGRQVDELQAYEYLNAHKGNQI